MISTWDIYLITRLDAIRSLFQATTVFTLLVGGLGLAVYRSWMNGECDEERHINRFNRYLKMAIITMVISCIGITLIPSTKEIAAIYLIPRIVNNQQVQKLPENLAVLLNTKMEQWVQEQLTEGKKK